MSHVLLVALGGGIGAAARHLAGLGALRLLGPAFPWGTLFVNIFGSLVMGLFIAWLVKRGGSNELRMFFATGILGGFTTFSAFSLDVANMVERGAMMPAFGYVAASVLISILALFIGLWFGRAFL
ncbi:MAG: fluoride efflux transporter CrcB [Rhizobiaceae bacterium]|nr:fluoride efflux transporter CrcB [Rhizobiaceae bacterium]